MASRSTEIAVTGDIQSVQGGFLEKVCPELDPEGEGAVWRGRGTEWTELSRDRPYPWVSECLPNVWLCQARSPAFSPVTLTTLYQGPLHRHSAVKMRKQAAPGH